MPTVSVSPVSSTGSSPVPSGLSVVRITTPVVSRNSVKTPKVVSSLLKSLSDAIVGWQYTSSMRGQYSASVAVTNQDDKFGENRVDTPILITLNADAVTTTDVTQRDSFYGDVDWIYGLVESVENDEQIEGKFATLSVVSFFRSLANKPVNTEKYSNASAATVLTDLATIYGGIPSSLFDFSEVPGNLIDGVVISGDNLLEEMRKVASAAGCTLFVRHDGILVAEPWKDSNDSVEQVISPKAVVSANIQRTNAIGPSRIKVRGKFISEYDEGEQALTSSFEAIPTSEPTDKRGKTRAPSKPRKRRRRGKHHQCLQHGIPVAEACIKLRGLQQDDPNGGGIINAGVQLDAVGGPAPDPVFDGVIIDGKGNMDVVMTGSYYDEDGGATQNIISVELRGRVRPRNEYFNNPNVQLGILQSSLQRPMTAFGNIAQEFMQGAPVIIKQIGNYDKAPDEGEPVFLEMTVDDVNLQTEFGVIVEEINNEYLSTLDQLFDVAVRRFQEFKMQRRTWTVNTTYLPVLRLNQVVQFTTPDGLKTVTGILTQMNIDFNPDPKASMSLTVESFEEIGTTEYCSGNLLKYPKLRAINGVTWVANDTTVIDAADGVAKFVLAVGGGTKDLSQEVQLEVGVTYTAKFDAGREGEGSFTLRVEDVQGLLTSVTVTEDSVDQELSFTARERLTTLKWRGTPPASVGSNWYLSEVSLQKENTK